jgi:hypothetical protein
MQMNMANNPNQQQPQQPQQPRPDVPTSWIIEDDVPQSMIDLGKEIQEFVDFLESLWISN